MPHRYKKSPLPAEMQIEGIYRHGGGAENRIPCSSASACCFADALANHWLTMRLCARACSLSRTRGRTRCTPRGSLPCRQALRTGSPTEANRRRISGTSDALHRPLRPPYTFSAPDESDPTPYCISPLSPKAYHFPPMLSTSAACIAPVSGSSQYHFPPSFTQPVAIAPESVR